MGTACIILSGYFAYLYTVRHTHVLSQDFQSDLSWQQTGVLVGCAHWELFKESLKLVFMIGWENLHFWTFISRNSLKHPKISHHKHHYLGDGRQKMSAPQWLVSQAWLQWLVFSLRILYHVGALNCMDENHEQNYFSLYLWDNRLAMGFLHLWDHISVMVNIVDFILS